MSDLDLSALKPWTFKSSEPLLLNHVALMTSPGQTYDDGALVIQDSKILDAGPSERVAEIHKNARSVDGRGFMIIPGIINAHTHCALSFFRGLGAQPSDQDPSTSMIETVLFPAERALTPELTEPLSYSYILDGLKAGVTCFVDHYYYIEGVGKALERFGVRGIIGETVADLGGAKPEPQAWQRARDLIERWPFSSRMTPAIAPHAADTVSRALLSELASFAKRENLPLHMHLSQTTGERQRVLAREGMTPVRYAQECGALGERSLLVHMVTADADDLKLVKDAGSTIGFCPASQILYERLAPIGAFNAMGIPVAVGTDCAASNDSADMLQEVKLAALMAHAQRGEGASPSVETVSSWYGAQAADSLGYGHQFGRLAPGQAADLVVLKLDGASLPRPQLAQGLTYSLGSRDVRHVMVDGQWVLWQQTSTLMSASDLEQAIKQATAEILSRGRS